MGASHHKEANAPIRQAITLFAYDVPVQVGRITIAIYPSPETVGATAVRHRQLRSMHQWKNNGVVMIRDTDAP